MISWQAYYKLWSFKSSGGIKLHHCTVPEGMELNSSAEEIILAGFWQHYTGAGLYMMVCQETGRCTESGAQVVWARCVCMSTCVSYLLVCTVYVAI